MEDTKASLILYDAHAWYIVTFTICSTDTPTIFKQKYISYAFHFQKNPKFGNLWRRICTHTGTVQLDAVNFQTTILKADDVFALNFNAPAYVTERHVLSYNGSDSAHAHDGRRWPQGDWKRSDRAPTFSWRRMSPSQQSSFLGCEPRNCCPTF